MSKIETRTVYILLTLCLNLSLTSCYSIYSGRHHALEYEPQGWNGLDENMGYEQYGQGVWPTLNYPASYNLYQQPNAPTKIEVSKSPPDPTAHDISGSYRADQSLERLILGNAPPEKPEAPAEVMTMPPPAPPPSGILYGAASVRYTEAEEVTTGTPIWVRADRGSLQEMLNYEHPSYEKKLVPRQSPPPGSVLFRFPHEYDGYHGW